MPGNPANATPLIVTCAPNGARKTQADHPRLPVTPSELASCAVRIVDEGAAMIHLHVRDDNGAHSIDADRYRQAIRAIRDAVGRELVIQVTSEACGIYSPEQQMAMVRALEPEAVSLALKELCAGDEDEPRAAAFFSWLQAEKIMPQYILYSAEEVVRFESLRERGVIPQTSPFMLFVLGRYASNLTGDVAELDSFVAAAAPDTTWAVCSFGATEHAAVEKACRLGGHARVGFENNLHRPDGRLAGDNGDLVRLAVMAGREVSREPASADDIRQRFADSL